MGRITALEIRATGIQWTFAPCVAVPLPRSMEQVPVNVGDADYAPLFPFGFGLTYSRA